MHPLCPSERIMDWEQFIVIDIFLIDHVGKTDTGG
jgi:hypothetical protein